MDKLKLDIKQNGRKVTMQVLEQDSNLRNVGFIAEYGGVTLNSGTMPALYENATYIRGDYESSDNEICEIELDNVIEAAEYANNLKTLENMINGRYSKTIIKAELLTIEFIINDCVLSMQVLEQDESIRGMGEIVEYMGLSLVSIDKPSLEGGRISVRGSDRIEDNIKTSMTFDSYYEAISYVSTAELLIDVANVDRKSSDYQLKNVINHSVYAVGQRNFGGIKDLSFMYDLNGATIKDYKTDKDKDGYVVSFTAVTKEGKSVGFTLTQRD